MPIQIKSKAQQFYQKTEIRLYLKMLHNNNKELEHDLLGSLLDDDEQQQSNLSTKSMGSTKRVQAFSAPPVFLDFDLKMNFDVLDQYNFDSPDPEDRNIAKAFCQKGSEDDNIFHSFSPQTNFRKMSCDSSLLSYYDSPETTEFDYYQYASIQVLTPEQELLNNVHKASEWAQDQNGSRAVQNIFDSDNMESKDAIFNVLIEDSKKLMKDRFGNYVFQKIFEKGSIEHKQLLLNSIWGQVIELSLHPYGCRVIQKSIEFIIDRKPKQEQFMEEIVNDGLLLMKNQNGNHVIQKCVEIFPHSIIEPFADIIIAKLQELPYDSYGCRVVQKYLENHRGNQKCEKVLKELLTEAVPLSKCQFGNYVMQHVVTKCEKEREKVFQIFLTTIVDLSLNKYASNVVEKAIQAQGSKFSDMLGDWFLSNEKQMVMLAKHQYGNYVVQSMFERLPKDKKLAVKAILKNNAVEISKSQFGRHVLMQLEKVRFK